MPSLGLGLVCVATLPTMVQSVEVFSPVTVIGMSAVMVGGLIGHRSYATFDVVLTAVENTTVGVMQAVAEETTKVIPIFVGIAVTLVLVLLRVLVNKCWTTPKERMKENGESPEGNALEGVWNPKGFIRDLPGGQGMFPSVPWLSSDRISLATRNLRDAIILTEGSVRRAADTLMSYNFEVMSQSGGKRYVVRLAKEICLASSAALPLRRLVSCGCPGHAVTLARTGEDDVCKHCGAVLLSCLMHYRPALESSPPPCVPLAAGAIEPRTRAATFRSPAHRSLAAAQRGGSYNECVDIARGRSPPEAQQTQAMLTLEDAQRGEPCTLPAARAASPEPRKLHFASIFEDYDENAEEAATLLSNEGKLLSVLSSKQTQKMGVNLLKKAKGRVIMTAFTLDLLIVCHALVETAQRGVQAQLFVDKGHSLKGSTTAQMDRLEMLRRGGVEVYLAKGVTAGGIQHSKALLVDGYYMCGSTNWTNSSRSNHESSVLIELSDEGKKAVMQKLGYMMQEAELLTQETVKRAQEYREIKVRGRSADPSPHRFGETARRFSVARARSREALLQAQV